MHYDTTFREQDLIPFLTIILSTFYFSIYWFIFASEKIKQRFYNKYTGDEGTIRHVLFTKYAGFIIMGILPAITFLILNPKYSLSNYGISFSKGTNLVTLNWCLALCIPIIVMNWFVARRSNNFSKYPQIRAKTWDKNLIFRYSLAWCVYLFGYEFLFRGILLIPLANSIGVWNAIGINIALYSATHIPKGIDETIGVAVLGLVLCLITMQTGTIWVAFFVHVALALSNSLVALKFHPEFKIVDKRTI